MKYFSIKLKELRQEKKLKQQELATILNSTQRTISNWENDIAEPPLETLKQIAIIFKTTADYLLGLEDDYGNKINTSKYYNSFNNSNIKNSNFK